MDPAPHVEIYSRKNMVVHVQNTNIGFAYIVPRNDMLGCSPHLISRHALWLCFELSKKQVESQRIHTIINNSPLTSINSGGAVWPTIFFTCSSIMDTHLPIITKDIAIAPNASTHQAELRVYHKNIKNHSIIEVIAEQSSF